MDIYYPRLQGDSIPAIAVFTEAGWVSGDKDRYQYYRTILRRRLRLLISIVIWRRNINFGTAFRYRGSFRWLKRILEEYSIDINSIWFLAADSAGVQIACHYLAVKQP